MKIAGPCASGTIALSAFGVLAAADCAFAQVYVSEELRAACVREAQSVPAANGRREIAFRNCISRGTPQTLWHFGEPWQAQGSAATTDEPPIDYGVKAWWDHGMVSQ